MKRLAFAVGLLVVGFGAATPALADYAVVKFNSGYCRVWNITAAGPQDGHFLWFRRPWGHHNWHYRFETWEGAHKAMHWAVAHHRCVHGPLL